MSDEEDLVEVGDDTPKLEEQARLNGWKAGVFNFGTRDNEPGIDLFNPGLIQRPDGLWLLVRRSENQEGLAFGKNGIWACQLKDRKPHGGPLLKFSDSDAAQQFEDARAMMWNNQVWISACNFTWFDFGSWTGAHQVVLVYRDDEAWTPIARKDPPVGKNREVAGDTFGRHEKNWVFFIHENRLHLLYHTKPWLVVEFGANWEDQKHHAGPSISSNHGDIRGGTPPILVGDLYWTFYHSSVPWMGRYRRYSMGALAFEARPPFKPVRMTQEPLLVGSKNDFWRKEKPLVIFPCGAIIENDVFYITYGINDLKCGFVEIPLEDVMKLATPIIDPSQSLIFDMAANAITPPTIEAVAVELEPAQLLDKNEIRRARLRANAAKARAALAVKRAAILRKKSKNVSVMDTNDNLAAK